jgi:signal peptidase II
MAPAAPGSTYPGTTNGVVFWPVAALVVLADVVTKAMAVLTLHPVGLPHEVFGERVRLTLVYNPGAAFGLHLGPHSRWIFLALTGVVLAVLWRLYRETRDRDNVRTASLALVCGGAVGNAIDRVRSADGVVDFIDLGAGAVRWPTFNLADIAVSVGAFLLAWVLWGEEQVPASSVAPVAPAPAAAGEPVEAP